MPKMKLVQEIAKEYQYSGDFGVDLNRWVWVPVKFQTWIDTDSIVQIREDDGHTDVMYYCGSACCEIHIAQSARELLE